MTKRKLSAKNILILTGTTAGLGVSVSISLAYIMQWPALWTMAMVNTLANTPLLFASSDALRRELGLRSPIQIVGNGSKRAFGRRIPINTTKGKRDIFMQTLALAAKPKYEPVTIDTVSIWYDNNEYTLTVSEIEKFIRGAWRLQRQNSRYSGLSRLYWTRRHRPRLKTLEYNIRIWVLTSCDGLVLNRGSNRSGRLSVSPGEAMRIIKNRYLD